MATKKKATSKKTATKTTTSKKTKKKKKAASTKTAAAKKKAASKKKAAPATPPQAELLSFLDTRADDDRFVEFRRAVGLKRNPLFTTSDYEEFRDKKRGFAFSVCEGWIFSVEVDERFVGVRAAGLAAGQSRHDVETALGRPSFRSGNVDRFERDLWSWHFRYERDDRDVERVAEITVAPIDIEAGRRKAGEPPRR